MLLENNSKKYNDEDNLSLSQVKTGTDYAFKHEYKWKIVFLAVFMHICGAFGLYKLIAEDLKRTTILWTVFVHFSTCVSITAGAHRYFSHKCYKASPVLRAYFIVFFTIAGQFSIFTWVRNHRLHHRYTDTDADPHNSNRGLFFSHFGWLVMKKHPLVAELGFKVDMRDLEADPWVMWQHKYYPTLLFLLGVVLPAAVPVYFGEKWTNAILVCVFFRYMLVLHITALVNSFAHLYGTRPYDKNLRPVENWFVSFVALGEGWHNYHHTFPWDYRTSEYGMHFNISASFIRLCEKLGLAWDLKTASTDIMEKRIIRTGDGTHHRFGNDEDRSAVTAFGPVHPLNPTYTHIKTPFENTLEEEHLPLFHEKDILSN